MQPQRRHLNYLLDGTFRRMSWLDWGDKGAPTVLCVHGLTRNAHDFDPLAEALAERYRVVCPDLPGRGQSEWLPDHTKYIPQTYVIALSYLLAAVGGPVDWIGTSLGGICGLVIAAAPGNPIARLILNDIGPFIPAGSLNRIRAQMAENPEDYADILAVETRFREIYAPFGKLTDAQWRAMAEKGSRVNGAGHRVLSHDPGIARAIGDGPLEDVDLSAYWQQVRVPVLAIRGERSDLLDESTLARMVADGASSFVVEGAGHAPALMDDAQIAAVRSFLDS